MNEENKQQQQKAVQKTNRTTNPIILKGGEEKWEKNSYNKLNFSKRIDSHQEVT